MWVAASPATGEFQWNLVKKSAFDLASKPLSAILNWYRVGEPDDDAVGALRKKLRGEPLTVAEEALLAQRARKPDDPTVPHEQVMLELEERRKREESSPRQK